MGRSCAGLDWIGLEWTGGVTGRDRDIWDIERMGGYDSGGAWTEFGERYSDL